MDDRPAPYIGEMQMQFLADEARVYPCHTNRASEAGHPCMRYLFYARTRWQDKRAPEPQLQSIFELGKDLEDVVIHKWLNDRLSRYGVKAVRPSERSWIDEPTNTTGHVDVLLEEVYQGRKIWIPGEIKTVSIGTWEEIFSWADMCRSYRHWVRKWATQLPLYTWMDTKPYGRYILFQKESGRFRDFTVMLDEAWDHLHEATEKLKKVNEYVAQGVEPPRVYEPGSIISPYCDRCDFGHICLPGGSWEEAVQFMDDADVVKLLEENIALKAEVKARTADMNRRLEEVKKILARRFEGKEKLIVGDHIVVGKWIERKAQAATRYWRWRLDKEDE